MKVGICMPPLSFSVDEYLDDDDEDVLEKAREVLVFACLLVRCD